MLTGTFAQRGRAPPLRSLGVPTRPKPPRKRAGRGHRQRAPTESPVEATMPTGPVARPRQETALATVIPSLLVFPALGSSCRPRDHPAGGVGRRPPPWMVARDGACHAAYHRLRGPLTGPSRRRDRARRNARRCCRANGCTADLSRRCVHERAWSTKRRDIRRRHACRDTSGTRLASESPQGNAVRGDYGADSNPADTRSRRYFPPYASDMVPPRELPACRDGGPAPLESRQPRRGLALVPADEMITGTIRITPVIPSAGSGGPFTNACTARVARTVSS